MRKIFTRVSVALVLVCISSFLWSQADSSATPGGSGAATSSDPMVAPAPVTGEGYSLDFSSEEAHTNYLGGGVVVGAAYDDDIASSVSGHAVSDVTYSVSPTITLDQTRSRLHWNFSYSPGYVFYQRYSSLNQSNQNVATKLSYRLSPHISFSVQEVFSKTANGYGQSCQNETGSLCGLLQAPNSSIVAPVTDTLNNGSNAQITYQFSPGGMVGASGNFSELRYPNPADAPGLFGSTTAGGSVFYTHRLSGKHYIGATYQYQKYLIHGDAGSSLLAPATQTQSLMLFYTFYLKRAISFSIFGGPQYSDTYGGVFPSLRSWSPGGGGTLNWQGQRTSFIASYSRRISDGGGLQGSVSYNGAHASIRHQFDPGLTGTLGADYSVNRILDSLVPGDTGGHTISGTCTLQRAIGEHFNLVAGYLRLHQTYNISAISSAPNQDRVWLSIGYQFQRSLGR